MISGRFVNLFYDFSPLCGTPVTPRDDRPESSTEICRLPMWYLFVNLRSWLEYNSAVILDFFFVFYLVLLIEHPILRILNILFCFLLFEYFFHVKVLNQYQNTPKNANITRYINKKKHFATPWIGEIEIRDSYNWVFGELN